MSIVENSTPTPEQNSIATTTSVAKDIIVSVSLSNDLNDLSFRLGLWLSGMESFFKLRNQNYTDGKHDAHDWSKEFRITHSVLLLCSKLSLELASAIKEEELSDLNEADYELLERSDSINISSEEIFELSFALKELVLLSEGLLRATTLKFSEWIAWSNSTADKLKNVEVVRKLIVNAERDGEEFLPKNLLNLLDNKLLPPGWDADLRLVLPRFAKILKWLSVIGEMLNKDEPLKTSLILFARINEQMKEMMDFINNRLLRFSNEEDALFGSLDAAAYTASIELRKVYDQELKGLAEIRPTPLIYAKIETSYSLLNDSLQLTLVNFAQLIDQTIDPTDIFPNLQTKEQQSIKLRENMWNLLQGVKDAEKVGDQYPLENLHESLDSFRRENLYYLFYKYMETVNRIIEDVLITDKKELVPILHRFGAYLETLLGQINMRAVLANHPFEPLHRESHEVFV